MKIELRDFCYEDINNKVKWVNNPRNNKFLHYNLPLEYEKTCQWFTQKNNAVRKDYTIYIDENPVGLIGLLNISTLNKKAEYYILIGDENYKGKNIGFRSTKMLLDLAFTSLNLNKIYLYTEVENIPAQKLFEKVGFKLEGILRDDIFYKNVYIDRNVYSFLKKDYENV